MGPPNGLDSRAQAFGRVIGTARCGWNEPVNSPLTVTCWRRSLRLFKAANYNLRKRWGVGSCMANPTTWNRKGHWGLGRQPKNLRAARAAPYNQYARVALHRARDPDRRRFDGRPVHA